MNKKYISILVPILLVLFSVVLYPFIAINILEIQMYKLGEFGDSFGMLTALFSGLAFVGLIITIIVQRKEMQAQNKTLKSQNKTLKMQRLENTFFKMLEFLDVCIKDITFYPSGEAEIISGRKAIIALKHTFFWEYIYAKEDDGIPMDKDTKKYLRNECKNIEEILKTYYDFYHEHGESLGQYYRVLYNIIKLVDNAKISKKGKFVYTNLVRAKLSKEELILIFYNCISTLGEEKMTPLVKKYKILKHLDKSLLPKEHLKLFKKNLSISTIFNTL